MAKTIYTLIHPFYIEGSARENMKVYKKVIGQAIADPESFLFYVASAENTTTSQIPPFHQREPYLYKHDMVLQRYFRGLPSSLRERVAVLADAAGEEAHEIDLFRPNILLDDIDDVEGSSLGWFAKHESPTFYNRELTKAYTDVTGVTDEFARKMFSVDGIDEGPNFHTEGDSTYVTTPVHPQVRKVIKFLGIQDTMTVIDGKPLVTIPKEVRHSTKIFGSGEYLGACVFDDSVGLSIALGIPVRNVTLNTDQPHIVREGLQNLPIWKSPVDTLYPHPRSIETQHPGFKK